MNQIKSSAKKAADSARIDEKVASMRKLSGEKFAEEAKGIKTIVAAEGTKGLLQRKSVLAGLGLGAAVVLLILVMLFVGGGNDSTTGDRDGSRAFAAKGKQPPEHYLNLNLRSVYGGMADGGTQQLFGVTLGEFLHSLNENAKAKWEKDGDRWLLKMRIEDKATNEKNDIVLVFNRWEGDYFKDDIILERMIINKVDLPPVHVHAQAVNLAGTAMQLRTARSIEEALSKEDLNVFKKLLKEGQDISKEEMDRLFCRSGSGQARFRE